MSSPRSRWPTSCASIADRNAAALFTPAVVTDASDGLIAHLHGLNLHRAWSWQWVGAAWPITRCSC
ncbi:MULTISPECIES: DUF2891 family protein [Actinomycetes]|uniref:DUF2891 family protein n=1 Tax=Actinomycetes TaxID=1760 RepID=UPI000998071E|nr:DUF2891 family protein [Amycolatopsis sp. AA4]